MSDERSAEPGEKSWLGKIAQAFSGEPQNKDDILALMTIARDNEIIDRDAQSIIEGALHVNDIQAREIMVPRPQMQVVQLDQPLAQSLPAIIEAGHSRYPVIGETIDDVKGILLAKDLLPMVLESDTEALDIKELVRPAVFVPESKRVNVLLTEFRQKRNHMAVVIDEYGGVAGLVTIEDVLEEIVGEIEDEYDVIADGFVRKVADNDFIIKALMPIEDFNTTFDVELSTEEFDTVGGLILQQFGRMPGSNETASIGQFEFRVSQADSRQIHLLRMRVVEAAEV